MSNYITTEELKREIENLGFNTREDNQSIKVTDCFEWTLAKVSKVQTHTLSMFYSAFATHTVPEAQEKLYSLLDRYARTPLDKREKQKRYRLKLDISDEIDFDDKYLCELISPKGYILETRKYCSEFSQAEIDEMGDLTKGFVKEGVCGN